MSFPMYILQKITLGFADIRIPMSGFYFSGCTELSLEYAGLEGCLVSVLKGLRETWVFSEPVVLILDEFGVTVWDRARDLVNGIVLVDPVLDGVGGVKIRSNTDRALFDKQMKLLKLEISARKDFLVFCLEHVQQPLSFHVLNHAVKFYVGNGFRYWFPKTCELDSVVDLVAWEKIAVSTDMLEISTAQAVVSCQRNAERVYNGLVKEGVDSIEIGRHQWDLIVDALRGSCDLWNDQEFISTLKTCSTEDFTRNLYQRIEFPDSPPVAKATTINTNQDSDVLHLLQAGSQKPSTQLLFSQIKKQGTQHTHLGVPTNPTRQYKLGMLVLNVLWDLKDKNLLASVRFNNDLGVDSERFSAPFLKMLNLFESILDLSCVSGAALWMLSLLESNTCVQVIDAIKCLVEYLKMDIISIWYALKVAFIPKDGTEGIAYDTIWSLTEERDGKLWIFVSDGHPCLEEVVLRTFFKHLGFSGGVCGIVEGLVSAQKRESTTGFNLPVPLRIVHEIKAAPRSKLMTFIRNEAIVIGHIQLLAATPSEAEYLTLLAHYVTQTAEYLLITQEAFFDNMKSFLDHGYISNTPIEEHLVEYIGSQTRSPTGLQTVSRLCESIHELLSNFASNKELELSFALCCLAFTIRKACRRCAYLELDLTITNMSTQVLPESDQVAVCLEMATTQATLQEIFNLSSVQLAPIFHREQRIKLFDESQKEKENVIPRVGLKNQEFRQAVLIANSYIYIYPILMDLVLNACLSSGLFFSERMDEETFEAASAGFLVSFPFIGALMNSFGRTMSFYFYQMSLPVMIVAVSHRLAASVTVLVFVALLVALFIFLFVSGDWILLVMGGVHVIAFGLYMIMYAVLVAFRDLSVPFYKSPGPLVSHSVLVWGIYILNLFTVVGFMMWQYMRIAKDFLDWPNAVAVTNKETILAHYESVSLKPVWNPDGEETSEDCDLRMRLWERRATEWYSEQLCKALKSITGAFGSVFDKAVNERIKQFKWERPLMAWFMQRSSIESGSIKVFSPEWDSLVKQAVAALSRKYQVDKLHRGSLLLHLEAPAIVFGFLYFIVIFIDKFALLIGTGKVGGPSSNNLNAAVAFATIYLLLAAGFLELTITSVSEQVNKFTYNSASSVEDPQELVAQYQSFTDRVYRSGVFTFAGRALAIFAIVSGFIGIYTYASDASVSILWKYVLECFSLSGLLVGLLNKMFVVANEHLLNKFLAVSIAVGLASSSILIRFTGDASYALLATGFGCWGFAICCLVVRQYERKRSPYYDISIGSLRTSGQKVIGFDSNSFTETQLKEFSMQLLSKKDEYVRYSPFSPLGYACLARLGVTIENVRKFGSQKEATDDLIWILKSSIDGLSSGSIVVRETPGLLKAGVVAYSAIGVKQEGGILEIFLPTLKGASHAEQTAIICNAIVHEVTEAIGMSHSSACGMENPTPTELSGDSPPLFGKNIATLNGLHLGLSGILEHCRTMTLVAHAISTQTQSTTASFTLNHTSPKTRPRRSFFQRISDDVNIFLAVGYFALTCDSSFSREVSYISTPLRLFLSAVYCLNQVALDNINQFLLFRQNNEVHTLQLTAKRGPSLIHSYTDSSLARISLVEGAEVLITAMLTPLEFSESHATGEWELIRFAGKKEEGWKPFASDTPVSVALFRKTVDGCVQIIQEKTLDNAGCVKGTALYSYSGGDIPISRNIFGGEVGGAIVSSSHHSEPRETHWFFTEGPFAGMVQFADLVRCDEVANAEFKITVEFEYQYPLSGKLPSRGIFKRSNKPDWRMSIEYAPFSDSGTPLQPLRIHHWANISETATVTRFDYSHPKHVVMTTILASSSLSEIFNSTAQEVTTPDDIVRKLLSLSKESLFSYFTDDTYGIMNLLPFKSIFDCCELLTKNLNSRHHHKLKTSWPFFDIHFIEYFESPYSTRHQRDMLWASWRAGKIPGVFARIMDQLILRHEPALKNYWNNRFMGRIDKAVQFLEKNRGLFNSILYVADRPTTRTRLQLRFSDLLIMGNGGDSEQISSFDQTGLEISGSEQVLEAICLDSGTWPTGGGGVGSCRRDLVDSLDRVRWSAIAEIAVMELEHKDYQIEKNVKSITYLPIFDSDFGNPMENFYKTSSFAELRVRSNMTTDDVVATKFLPLVSRLIDACMTNDLESKRLQQDEQMIVGLYQYFRTHDWKLSWDHPMTQKIWVKLLLKKAKELEKDGTLLLQESPTLAHLNMLFGLITRLLLILSKKIPNVPVVHISHHGSQSLIAVVASILYGTSITIWDHGMLWRERLFALCRDGMPPFTQIGFIGFTRLCTRLVYHRADYVTPCTNVQNVMWAAHLAGGKYLNDLERTALVSKCSAVLNGMNLKKFQIKRDLARQTPTAVMLSHISPVKDVLNAIQAAFHIVHEFKLASYQLHVYGSPNMDMDYTLACRSAIKDLNLESNVVLKGLANPAQVLPTGWVFVNSSITEGLPLAIGEASLCGLPVVCTNVGGSLEVISDLKTGALYGAIVPPSRSRQLALGQLKVLGMTDGLDVFVDASRDRGGSLTVQELVALEPKKMEERIMDPEIRKLREELGEMFCEKTKSVFSISRYCREHEQVLWLGELYARHCHNSQAVFDDGSSEYFETESIDVDSFNSSVYHDCYY
ncbi:UNVERIFIED_CONTAM: hypothetical protein HDU68_010352 [Siphonaria sp. JEL0065]|nr:hypothetical protein HDU68_010352 [Siphonaria sp. JEL0065]